MDPTTIIAIGAIIVGAGSEIIGLLPIKANTWIQLILQIARLVFPKR
jgi:hypothetical protein